MTSRGDDRRGPPEARRSDGPTSAGAGQPAGIPPVTARLPAATAELTLRGGLKVHLRPIRQGDEDRLLAFLRQLSPESLRYRFLDSTPDLEHAAACAVHADHERYGLLATAGREGRIVGHAEFVHADGERADIGVVVADDWRNRGLGSALVGQLAAIARQRGILSFQAEIDPKNRPALDALRDRGFESTVHEEPGLIVIGAETQVLPERLAPGRR